MPLYSPESLKQLATVHPDLQRVFNTVIKFFDCKVLEGVRTLERQKELVSKGLSKTLESKHLIGEAVDAVPYPVDWEDRERMVYFAGMVMGVAEILGVKLRWGNDWNRDTKTKDNTFDDLPHFELVK